MIDRVTKIQMTGRCQCKASEASYTNCENPHAQSYKTVLVKSVFNCTQGTKPSQPGRETQNHTAECSEQRQQHGI